MKTRAVSLILALALLSGCAVSGADASPQANPSVSGAAQAGYPVATPTPTPTPVPEPTPTPTPTVEPTPTPAPTPEPTPTPAPTPMPTPAPTPEPTPTPTPTPEPTPTPPPTPTAEPSASTGPSPSPEPTELPEEPFFIDLTLVGDCLLSTYKGENYEGSLNWYAENREPTYFFEKVASYFEQDDFTIVNLETVLTDRPLEEVDKGGGRVFWFRGPARNAEILSSSSVEVASLSNNHIRDYGDEGVADTIAAVEAAGVEYGNWGRTVYLEKNGFVIAVLCCGLWGEWNTGGIVDRIRNESEKSDYQLVFFHGGIERSRAPEEWMVTACHSLIDAGADLVVGAHPHVLQPMEEYNGKRIVYSLGNFCFGGNTGPENRTVIYQVRLTVDGGAVQEETHTLVPCYVFTGYTNNWQPAPITDETQKQYVLDFMAGLREKPF